MYVYVYWPYFFNGRLEERLKAFHKVIEPFRWNLSWVLLLWCGPWYLSRYSNSLRAGRSGDRIPVEDEIFRTRPDRPWSPPSLLYSGYRVSFPMVKRPGRGVDHQPRSTAEVKERVELYLYFLSGPSWPVLERALALPSLLLWNIFGERFSECASGWAEPVSTNLKRRFANTELVIYEFGTISSQFPLYAQGTHLFFLAGRNISSFVFFFLWELQWCGL